MWIMTNKALKIPLICPRKSIYSAIVYDETTSIHFISQLCETQHNHSYTLHQTEYSHKIHQCQKQRLSHHPNYHSITTRILFWKPHRRNSIVRTLSIEHHSSVCTFSLPTRLMVYSTVSLMLVHPDRL